MNFKHQARELENYLEHNFQKNMPLALLPNGNIAYKDFIIKKTKQDKWELSRDKVNPLDIFNIKT